MSGSGTRAQRADTPAGRRGLPFHWSYLLLAAFLVFFAWKYLEKTREVQGLARQESALRASNQQIKLDNERTRHVIQSYRSTQYVESQARSQLGYTLPGETSVQITPKVQRPPVVRAAPPRPATPPAPTWRQWWNAFFG